MMKCMVMLNDEMYVVMLNDEMYGYVVAAIEDQKSVLLYRTCFYYITPITHPLVQIPILQGVWQVPSQKSNTYNLKRLFL